MPIDYSLSLNNIQKESIPLSLYQNRVLLIVNVASQCSFTPQYKELEELYQKYKDKGLMILGFPCNQFAGQEPSGEEEILNFCQKNYGVSFPLFEKTSVNGKETHPLYKILKKEKKGLLLTEAIKWNFTKFLISKKGEVLERFSPSTLPLSLEEKIKEALL